MRATGVERSRRFLRELDEAPGGNNLQYILKCPCIPFFGNQGLHNEIVLGGNGGCSGVMYEGSSYRTQNIPRTQSREEEQMQLGQASERTAGWESLVRCTLGLYHTHKVQCWGCRQGDN